MIKHSWSAVVFFLAGNGLLAGEPASIKEKEKEIAGTAEFLRSVPKFFASLKSIDKEAARVTVLIDGEKLPKSWTLTPDAELKVMGWWARLDHFNIGDRVWIWFQTDRSGQPSAISMMADDPSEQDIHGAGFKIDSIKPGSISLKPAKGNSIELKIQKPELFRERNSAKREDFKVGEKVYVQSRGGEARLILDAAAFELRRSDQRSALRKVWTEQGLPGSVAFLHRFSGEMDLMLDHEAMRWGRALKPGDKVTINVKKPIEGLVKNVNPWRERTLLRLVVNGADQTDLAPGQRVYLKTPAPMAEVDASPLPPDIDRPRAGKDRVEWFLASIYCCCSVGNDTCTGMFYTLASCNPNGCGMPDLMRKTIADKIAKGKTDKQIFEELIKENPPELLKPHLAP